MVNLQSILIIGVLFKNTLADSCTAPTLPNGSVSGEGDGSTWTGSLSCHPGFTLVGSSLLKCRRGQWSSVRPVCTAIGRCDPSLLPDVENGRKVPYQTNTYRGAVYKYSCRRGFKRYGNSLIHCNGDSWVMDTFPLCSKPGCDENLVKDIRYGQSKRKAHGGVYKFRCDEGTVLKGSDVLICDGRKWNGSVPSCLSPALPPSIKLEVDGVVTRELVDGSKVTVTCEAEGGNPVPALSITIGENEVGHSLEAGAGVLTYTFVVGTEHNAAVVSCSALNSAMAQPLFSERVLNVKFGPKKVALGGPGSLVQGHAGGFECFSSPSNPPSDIQWKLVDQRDRDFSHLLEVAEPSSSWTGTGWETTSTAALKAEIGVGSLHLTCTSTNPELQKEVEDTKHISIQFAPEKVTITGPQRASLGSRVSLECISSPSVPATSLTWSIKQANEVKEQNTEEEVEQLLDGSFVTRAHLEVEATKSQDLVVECYGNNKVLGKDSRAYAHIVEILSPPGSPKISSLHSSTNSEVQELVCASSPSGNPPATLAWYDGSQMMDSHYEVEGGVATAKITFVPSNEERVFTCEASSLVLAEPLRNTIKLESPSSTLSLPSTSILTKLSTTTLGYEYDEEEEDDQIDYYAEYNNTQEEETVVMNLSSRIEKEETLRNSSKLMENEESKEYKENDAVDSNNVHQNDSDVPLQADIDVGGKQLSNTNSAKSRLIVTEATVKEVINKTESEENMTLMAKQTMSSANSIYINIPIIFIISFHLM